MSDLIINQMEKNIAEDNIIKDMRNLFTSKRKCNFIYGKTTYNNKRHKNLIWRRYYKVRIDNAFSSKYIKYESNGDKDKTLSIKEYLIRLDHI